MENNNEKKYTCECGSTLLLHGKNRHERTLKHKNFLSLKIKNISVNKMINLSEKAETQKNFRERQRELLGNEEYKRIESEKRRQRRLRQKLREQPPKVEVEDDKKDEDLNLTQFNREFTENLPTKSLINRKNKNIDPSTNAQYMKRLSFLYRSLTGEKQFKADNLEWLRDVNKITKFINTRWTTTTTKNAYINAITSILARVPSFEEEHKLYSSLNSKLIKKTQTMKENNVLSDKELKNILSWKKILSLGSHIKDPRDKLIYSMYTEIPPRRLDDYRLMKIVRNRNQKFVDNLPKDFNYIYLDKKDIPKYMIINKYKTASTYGSYKASVPTKLGKIIQNYVKKYQLKNCDFLFSQEENCKVYTPGAFSAVVTDVFKNVTGKNLGVDLLRVSFISFIYSQRISTAEKNKIAIAMGHSRETAENIYNKINL